MIILLFCGKIRFLYLERDGFELFSEFFIELNELEKGIFI